MKKSLFYPILLSLTILAQGQNTFLKTYGGTEGGFAHSSLFVGDSLIYTYGVHYPKNEFQSAAFLIKSDDSGDTILTRSFQYLPEWGSNTIGQKIMKYSDSLLVLTGTIDAIGPYTQIIDLNADTIWHKNHDTKFQYFDMVISKDSTIVLVGFEGWSDPFGITIEMNKSGDTLWTKKIENTGYFSINNTESGNYILSGKIRRDIDSEFGFGLIKMDSEGDTLWTKPYYQEFNSIVSHAFETKDSSFILTGGYYNFGEGSAGFLLKTDQDGELLWTNTYHKGEIDDYIITAVENKDSTITFISNIVIDEGFSSYIRLTKVNIDGSVLWNRDFSSIGCFANDLIISPDGGYLISGYYRNNPANNNFDDALLIRTDEDGLVFGNSPLIANAGSDTTICEEAEFFLGANPTASGGMPSYRYSWSALYDQAGIKFYASDFLSDTTSPNPLLKDILDSVSFYLEVVDGNGNFARDTIHVKQSSFVYCLADCYSEISIGDSVQLSDCIHGGTPPYSFHWTPSESLSDPLVRSPWAKPSTSTQYFLLLIDAIGCEATSSCFIDVFPVSSELNLKNKMGHRLFQPHGQNYLQFDIEKNTVSKGVLKIYDLSGKVIYETRIINSSTSLIPGKIVPGVYIYQYISNNSVYEGKFIYASFIP